MGMNSGIHDAFNLADKLVAILRGEADEDVLDRYERQRRHVAVQHTQAQTMRNKRLLAEKDPAVRQKNHDELRRTAEDPEARARVPAALVADREPARGGEDTVNSRHSGARARARSPAAGTASASSRARHRSDACAVLEDVERARVGDEMFASR